MESQHGCVHCGVFILLLAKKGNREKAKRKHCDGGWRSQTRWWTFLKDSVGEVGAPLRSKQRRTDWSSEGTVVGMTIAMTAVAALGGTVVHWAFVRANHCGWWGRWERCRRWLSQRHLHCIERGVIRVGMRMVCGVRCGTEVIFVSLLCVFWTGMYDVPLGRAVVWMQMLWRT